MPGIPAQLKAIARSRAVWALADQAIVSGGSFLTQFFLLRELGREEFGLFGVGYTVVQFMLNTQAALVTTAFMVYFPRTAREERPRYTGSSLIHQAVIAFIGTIGLLCTAFAMHLHGSRPELAAVMFSQASVIFFILFRDYARQLSFAALHVPEAIGVDTVFVGLQFAGMVALVYVDALTAPRAFLMMGAAALIAGVTWLCFTRQAFRPSPRAAWEDWKRNWHFSRWIFATNVAFLASNLSYPWVLLYFHGPAANGALQASLLIGFQLINPFILGMGNFLAPRTAHAMHDGGYPALKAIVRKADLLFLTVVGGYCLTLFVGGTWLLTLFSGGKYSDSAPVVYFLAVGQLFFALTITANHALNALERPNIAFQALLISALMTWTAGVWLVWQQGPLGAAIGQALGAAAALAYTRWHYYHAIIRPLAAAGGN